MASAAETVAPPPAPGSPVASRAEHTAAGTIQNLSAHALLLPTGFVIAAFVSRALGPTEYGTLAVAISVVTWLESLLQNIFSSATVRFVAEDGDWRVPARSAAQAHTGVAILVAGALCLAAPAMAALFGTPELTRDLRLFAIDVPLISLAYLYANVLAGKEQFGKVAATSATFWTGRMVFMVALVALTRSVTGAIVGTVCASAARLLVSRLFVRVPLWGRSTFPARRLLSYTSVSLFFAITLPLFDKVGLFLTKALDTNPQAAGYYGAALNLITVPTMVAGTVGPLMVASVTKEIRAGGWHEGRMLVLQGNRVMLMMLPFTGVAAGCAGGIIGLIYGPDFAPAAAFFQVLAFASAAWALVGVATYLLVAAGRLRWLLALHLPLLPALIASGALATSRAGGIGGAWATLAVGAVGAAAAMLLVLAHYGVLARRRTVVNVLLATAAPLLAGGLWPAGGALVILKFGVLAAADFGLLVLLREFDAGDLWFAKTLAARFISQPKVSQQPC